MAGLAAGALHRRVLLAVVALGVFISRAVAVDAQTQYNQYSQYSPFRGNALGNAIGGMIRSQQLDQNQKSWNALSPEEKECLNIVYARKNVTVDGLIRSGISATDPRLSRTISFCYATTSRQLRIDIPCTVTNDKGQSVGSTCVEAFVKTINGVPVPIPRDEYIRLSAMGANVQIASLETPDARDQRIGAEKAHADIDHQKFLESPEGKKQAALEAALERENEAKKKQAEKDLSTFRPY